MNNINIVPEHLDQEDFVGFWKRFLAVILDFLVLLIPAVIVYWSLGLLATSLHSEIPIILQYLLFIIFEIFMIVRYGGTPGKLILKMRIINTQGNYPNLKQALIRNVFQMINVVISMVMGVSSYDFTVISNSLSLWTEVASDLSIILAPIMLADYLFIAFNQRKRALHDLMAGTYVVDKSAVKGNA